MATIVASALVDVPDTAVRQAGWNREPLIASAQLTAPAPVEPVSTGVDELRRTGFAALRGLRTGLLTNHTGRTRDGAATIDFLAGAPGVKLVALFSPEHGIRGDSRRARALDDRRQDRPADLLSYGETRRPTSAMLEGLDAIVIDLRSSQCIAGGAAGRVRLPKRAAAVLPDGARR